MVLHSFIIHAADGAGADSLLSAAKKSIEKNDYPSALIQFNQYLSIALKLKDSLMIGNAHIGIGIAYDRSGDYEDGLNHYFSALHFYENIGNKKKVAGTLKNIGNIYRMLKSYARSRVFLQQAYSAYTSLGDSTGTGNVLNDMGIVYMDEKHFAQAIGTFSMIISTYGRNIKEEVKALAMNNLASCYMNTGQYTRALTYYNAALALMKQRNDTYGSALVYLNLSELFQLQGNLIKSIEYGNKSISLSKTLQSKGLLTAAYKIMADAYLKLKDYKRASFFLAEQVHFKDTVFKEETARSYAEMETKYQNEKKQTEILRLEHLNTLKNSKITKQRLERNFLFTGLACVIIITIIILGNYRVKQAANRTLHVLNARLQEANSSKTKLLGIISHDLRSPVSSLFSYLQLQRLSPGRLSAAELGEHNVKISEAAENLLEAMEDVLIWAKSQMENFNPLYETVNISTLIDEIIKVNDTAAQNKNITLLKDCPSVLNVNTDTNFLKIIFRNLTSNAIKFTPEEGCIILSCKQTGDACLLSVTDNGNGIEQKDLASIFEWNSIRSDSSGLGLKLAKEFTEKLNGTISVQSELHKGTSFIIRLPLDVAFSSAEKTINVQPDANPAISRFYQ